MQPLKNVVIFCKGVSSDCMPFSDPYYWESYQDLLFALKARGVNAYFVAGNETYKGNGLFSVAYTASKRCPVEDFEEVTNIIADLVFNRDEFTGSDIRMLNPAIMTSIIISKMETYKHFAAYQPLTLICNTAAEVSEAFSRIPGDIVVAKEARGDGGDFVYIGTREKVAQELPERFPMLIQEFLDTSVGISGIVEGMHDLRIEIAGGIIVGGTIRRPVAAGEYRANIALGGEEWFLFPDEIPAEAVKIALEIDEYFKTYPRHYAIDFGNTATGFKLIETNARPGLSPANSSPQAKYISDSLADYLVKIIA